MSVLSRILIGVVGAAGAVMIGPGVAQADPEPAPALPNVNAYAPAKPSEYAVMDGSWYAFGAPGGLNCVMDRQSGRYGCSGPIPAAPGGANIVTGGPAGAPGFTSSDRPLFGVTQDVKPLAPNTRLSFRTVSCGTDGVVTSCVNSFDSTGFVLSPAGSYVLEGYNPRP